MPNYMDGMVLDSYYSTTNACLSINAIKDNLIKANKHIYEVKSLKEAMDVFSMQTEGINPALMERFVFRGVNKEYLIKRPYPNPWVCDSEGCEPSLISSIWRPYSADNYSKRPTEGCYASLFSTTYADSLIYKGIDVAKLMEVNLAKYGPHSLNDLEDFPDHESQEYYKRYLSHKVYGNDGYTLEQHYGIATPLLDVTFDLPTALFFALHKFVKLPNGNATYELQVNEASRIYCIIYSNPPLTASRDMIEEIQMFDHLKPIRPIRQKCAVVNHYHTGINESAFFVLFSLKLNEHFCMDGIPTQEMLFPNPDEDEFYKELLVLRDKHPDICGDIVNYE